MATHLAATFPDKFSFLLADRTFGSLKDVSIRKFIGQGASGLFDFITFQWQSNNHINYFKVRLALVISYIHYDRHLVSK